MSDVITVARRLYDAFGDPAALTDVLHDDFVGIVSAGMPLGVGGVHHGRDAMLRDVWGPVGRVIRPRVEPERFLPTADDQVVVLGHYRGDDFAAAFAHIITVRGDRLASLEQITDTRSWPVPTGV